MALESLRAGARPGSHGRNERLPFAVRRRRAARGRARLRRPGARRARAQSGPARDPAARDRFVVDRLAGRAIFGPALGGYLYAGRPTLPMPPAPSCSPLVGWPVPDPARSRGRRSTAAATRGSRWSRPPLRPPQPAGAGRHQPRSVRGAARRCDGDAAGVRPRHPPRRAGGPWPPARRARGRGYPYRRLLLVPPAEAQCRASRCSARSAVFGAATIVFGLSRSMPLSLACLALLGAADMLSVYVRQSLIQLYTPDAMRGRVGASHLFISASNELGEAGSPVSSARWSARSPRSIGGGVGAIAVVFLWFWSFPELRLARTFEAPDCAAAKPAEESTHEGRQHPRDDRQDAAHPASTACSATAPKCG